LEIVRLLSASSEENPENEELVAPHPAPLPPLGHELGAEWRGEGTHHREL